MKIKINQKREKLFHEFHNGFKVFLFFFLVILSCEVCVAQRQNQIFLNDSANLIQSGIVYETEILSIKELKNGFGFFVKVKIENNKHAFAFIVSTTKENLSNIGDYKAIHKGDKLKLLLIDYFDEPLCLSIEYKRVYEVLLGNEKVVIPAGVNGWLFNRIFVSPQIKSHFFKETKENTEFQKISDDLTFRINYSIVKFINHVSFEYALFDWDRIVDTTEFIKSVQSLSYPYLVVSPDHPYNKKNENNLRHTQFAKMNWEIYVKNPNCFYELLRGMLNYFFHLPFLKLEDKDIISEKNINIRILYYNAGMVTCEVKWIIENNKYSAVLTLCEKDGAYKISYLNLPNIESCFKNIDFN